MSSFMVSYPADSYSPMLSWADTLERSIWTPIDGGSCLTLDICGRLEVVGKLRAISPRPHRSCLWFWEPTSCGQRALLPLLRLNEAESWITGWLESDGVLARPEIMPPIPVRDLLSPGWALKVVTGS